MLFHAHNKFHNTVASFRASYGDPISARVYRRLQRDLCGMGDCTCGGIHRATIHSGGIPAVLVPHLDRSGRDTIALFSWGRA